MARDYLKDQTYRSAFISSVPADNLSVVVVIPCFKEPNLIATLNSLLQCEPCKGHVEVIIVINQSIVVQPEEEQQNRQSYEDACQWVNEHQKEGIDFYIHYEKDLPKKHAGVGLARKIGMDEALRRFKEINRSEGVILCYDADSSCTPDYLSEVEKHFESLPETPGCSIHFEHPVEGNEYSHEVYDAIVQYELHLRYYRQALLYSGHPHAYHTIGSSMAVRANVYEKQGGMNRRKAGEDFYFLQKVIPLGNFSELNSTMVIPSPRPSDRVPFGTGKAVNDQLVNDQEEMETYHPQLFEELQVLLEYPERLLKEDAFEKLPDLVKAFLETINYKEAVREIYRNTTSEIAFRKRFYNWFNAFVALKFVHFGRDHFYPNISLNKAANVLLEKWGRTPQESYIELLNSYRNLDKENTVK